MPSIGTLLAALGNDLYTVDGAQAVTYTCKNPPNADQSVSIPDAVQTDFSDAEVADSGGYLEYTDRKWIFEDNKLLTANPSPPPALIASRKPKAGDTLLDGSGTLWEILDTSQDSITLAWECVARKAR